MSAVRDIAAASDPVAAVLEAHELDRLISLQTSGTTTRPRSVVRSTASWVDSFPHVSRLTGIGPDSRVWVPGPLTATMNLFAAVHARAAGATLVRTPEHATHAHLTPATLMAALGDGVDLDGVHVVVAGDRLPGDVAGRAGAAGVRTSHYYGAAELSFVAWGTHEEDLRAFPGVEMQVRGDVIWVRSPYLSLGYAEDADGPFAREPGGFATVGDRGRLDGGLLTVTGRGTAIVLTGGATVLVADVEQALRRSAGTEVVVVGVRHPRLGQIVGAVVTEAAAADRARAAARAELAAAQRPRVWFCVPTFPLTGNGKIDRPALSAMLATGRVTTLTHRGPATR